MAKTIKKLFANHFLLVLFLFLYFILNFYKVLVNPPPFYDWDESIYVQVGREMVNSRSIVPLWQGKAWLDKPPLVPLFYGVTAKIFYFIKPEISLRTATLIVSIITLIFLYALYQKVFKDRALSVLTIAVTSFIPIFIQRSTAVNIDVFLLLGWVGYALFYENFWLSLFFLTLSVMSKSLVGFYPAAIVTAYLFAQFLFKKISLQKLKKGIIRICFQVGILSVWYIVNLLIFGQKFFVQHIIETHFRRVTASLEFHFGKKTFYLDLAREQLGQSIWIAIVGLILLLRNFIKKHFNLKSLFFGLFLLPWFIFLNLTKTKIFWYLYPSLPQFAFLAVYPISVLKKFKIIYIGGLIIALLILLNANFIKKNFFTQYYSSFEPHYYLSLFAKDKCKSLSIVVDPSTRQAFATLASMNLLITTSKWWGNHPSVVYYFEKPVDFIYEESETKQRITSFKPNQCLVFDKSDLVLVRQFSNLILLNKFDSLYLFTQK